MRDMAGSRAIVNVSPHATLTVANCKRASDAETDCSREKTPGPRLDIGAADHGAARPARPALEPAHCVGTPATSPDVTGPAHGLRPGLAHGAAGPVVRAAPGRLCRTHSRRRIPADGARPRSLGEFPAAASLRRALEQARCGLKSGRRDRQAGAGGPHGPA